MAGIDLNNADEKITAALEGGRNTPSNLAEELDYSREYVSQRLKRLREHDVVERVGRGLYQLPDGGRDRTAEIEQERAKEREKKGGEVGGKGSGNATQPLEEESGRSREKAAEKIDADGLLDELREYLSAEGRPPKTEHGRAAVVDIVAYLREHDTAATGDLKDAVYPNYADEWGSERVMWESVRRYFDDVPGIEKAGYGKYAYAGDEAVREAIEVDSGGSSGPYDPTEEFK